MKFQSQTHYQRFMLGIICGLLPIVCLLFGMLGQLAGINNPNWYVSISATYFANSNMCMIGALCLCAFFLFTYQGYKDFISRPCLDDVRGFKRFWLKFKYWWKRSTDIGDKGYTTIAGIAALLIVACPCAAKGTDPYLGLFALPAAISDTIHSIAATVLFLSFALMILTQFTKGGRKHRNIIYYICGAIMLAAMAAVVAATLFEWPPYMTMILETVMLEAFALAWVMKSDII